MSQNSIVPDVSPHEGTEKHTLKENFGLSILKPGGKIYIDEIKKEQDELIPQINFPVEVFPGLFGDYIRELNKSLNFPTDYSGTSVIVAVATTIGKSCVLKVKGPWIEHAATYACLVGGAGANKSHPIDSAFDPFSDIDYESSSEFEKAYNNYNDYQSLSKKEKEFKDEPSKPILKKTILHNATPEILGQRIADNDRACAFVSDELAFLLENMNNYSKGDNSSAFMTMWSGKSTSIDRVSKPVPLSIREPYLSIIGSAQPRILPKLFPANKTDNGFLQRFIWAFPSVSHKLPINDNEVDQRVIDKYNEFIKSFIRENPTFKDPISGKNKPNVYTWSLEAKAFFYDWSIKNTEMVNANSNSLKGEVISKFDIHFCRLALILQIMEEGQKGHERQKGQRTNEISINSVKAASILCDYYLSTAFKVLDILTKTNVEDVLPEKKSNLYNALPESFTTSEANIIGDEQGFNIKAVQRFLSDNALFSKVSQGNYKKIVKS